ncbi:UNVERIFIED_CONTAM: hypothetical protein Slati_2179600 [Sesamum latifolium]|uniref:Uncharacterized protein n=1 Tax=Sesamum latifolium TaxID=2727402 RepID=A0AAW2WUE5_9LAMI
MPSPGWSLQVPSILGKVVYRWVVGTFCESGGVSIIDDSLVKKESFYSRSLELQGVFLVCKESYPPGGILLARADVVQGGC